MAGLTSKTAQTLINLALDQAAREFQRPICAAVCDAYGFLMAFARVEGAPIRSIAIAEGKAYTAACMGENTAAFVERLHRETNSESLFYDENANSRLGGRALKNAAGELVGAIGISGLAPDEDQAIADAAAALVAAD